MGRVYYCTKTTRSHIHLYSQVLLIDLWLLEVKDIAKVLKWQQEDSNMGSLDRESGVLTDKLPSPTNRMCRQKVTRFTRTLLVST